MYAKTDVKVHLLLFSVTVSNGLNYSVSKIVMNGYLDPMAIILIRIVVTSLFFYILEKFMGVKEQIQRADYVRFALCSFLGIAANQLFFYNGLNLTTPINAAVMTLMTPIIIFLITYFIIKEKTAWWQLLGVCLACLGAGLLLFSKGVSIGNSTLTGDLMILANSTVYAVFVVLVAPLMRKYHSVTVMKVVFSLAIPMVLPITYNNVLEARWGSMGLYPWLALAFIVFIGTIYNYYINTWSLKHVSAAVSGGYIYLIPFQATLFAVLFNNDTLTVNKVMYGLLIFLGLFLVGRKVAQS